jgi:error-prone DNA polymerase
MWEVEETLHDDLPSSACVSRTGESVPLSRTFLESQQFSGITIFSESSFRRDAETSTRDACATRKTKSPLLPMTLPERVRADYETMNLTTGPHPMKLLRASLPNIWRASDLLQARQGATVQVAGNVICRQRPGTAKGFVFISLEDETGVSNAIVDPNLFERFRLLITEEAFLLIEGEVQNSDDVVLIKTRDIRPLAHQELAGSESHDFH